jgi:predicted AlkP superfamily pyrophosphatase or phosphodiesterase
MLGRFTILGSWALPASGQRGRMRTPLHSRRARHARFFHVTLPITLLLVLLPFLDATPARAGIATSWKSIPQYLVLIVLDGARPDYLNVAPLPHLDKLMSSGTQFRYAMSGILESETPSGHTTISTGSTPARDGILGFSWGQGDHDYSLFNPTVVRQGAMEHIMEAAHVPTIAGLYKSSFPTQKVIALSGSKYYAADPLGGPRADAIMYFRRDKNGTYVPTSIPSHSPPPAVMTAPGLRLPSAKNPLGTDDHLATQLALSAMRVMYPHIILINYPEFDWPLGHVDGGDLSHLKVLTLMQGFDHDLGLLEAQLKAQKALQRTLFVITADHGMSAFNHNIPDSIIYNAIQKAGAVSPAKAFNNGAYIWLTDPAKARAVADNIPNSADPGIQSVYYLASSGTTVHYVRAWGDLVQPGVDAANQYLLSTLLNGHEPNVVVLAKNHATFSQPSTHWKADHGGVSWQAQHIPLVLSGPGIRPGEVLDSPAQLDDIAPTVLQDMGIAPVGMQGQVLTDALLGSYPAAATARKQEAGQFVPFIEAMLQQDTYETMGG